MVKSQLVALVGIHASLNTRDNILLLILSAKVYLVSKSIVVGIFTSKTGSLMVCLTVSGIKIMSVCLTVSGSLPMFNKDLIVVITHVPTIYQSR